MHNEEIQRGINILINWQTSNPKKIKSLIEDFYGKVRYERGVSLARRCDPIASCVVYIDNHTELLSKLIKELGGGGLEDLIIYLLENDRRYTNTDDVSNCKDYKPYPSYLIWFAYALIFVLPKRSRRLFESFWEHKAKIRPGIDEGCVKWYFDKFIEEGITTKDEIRDLTVKDWYRWQESLDDSPYYGPCLGVITRYFKWGEWDAIERVLEDEWRKKRGSKPKKF